MSLRDEGAFVVVLMENENHSPQILLQIRQNTGMHDGIFVFPGGKRENNENWKAAARRELYEETGLVVEQDKIQKLCQREGRDPDGTKWLVKFYLCFIDPDICDLGKGGKGRVAEPKKHSKVQWHPLNKLPNEDKVHWTVRAVIPEVEKFLLKDPKAVAPGLRNPLYYIKKNKAS